MMEFTYDGFVRWGFGFHNPNHAAAAICALLPFVWGFVRAEARLSRWVAAVRGLVTVALFVAVVATFHYISLGSICAAAFLLVSVWLPCAALSNPDGYRNLPQCVMVSLVAAFAIWKHRANISRLLSGTENRFCWRTKK